MTHEEIEKLETLERAATPGEWREYPEGICTVRDHPQLHSPTPVITVVEGPGRCDLYMQPYNRAFLVAWRNAAHAIIAALREGEQVRVEREALEKEGACLEQSR